MKILAKRVRDFLERHLGIYYEGPDPPDRLQQVAELFASQHPDATVGDWVDFACSHAAEAWRSAFIRGVEHVERDPEGARPDMPPEMIADLLDPDWRESPAIEIGDVDFTAVVPTDMAPEHEVIQAQMERANEVWAGDPILRGSRRG